MTRRKWALGGALGVALASTIGWALQALELRTECTDTIILVGTAPADCPHDDHERRVEWRFDAAYLICTCSR